MTAIIVCGKMIWSAWAGDSRASVAKSKGRRVEDLSLDHKCDIPAEAERMQQAGGMVVQQPNGVARVCVSAGPMSDDVYTLNMSRSMGDKFFHDHGGVVATPEVLFHDIGAEDKALIVCSDGVWEHVTSQDAADCVMSRLSDGGDASVATKALVDMSMRRWKDENPVYRDDITAVVLDLAKLTAFLGGGGGGEAPRNEVRGRERESGDMRHGSNMKQAAPPGGHAAQAVGHAPMYRRQAQYKQM